MPRTARNGSPKTAPDVRSSPTPEGIARAELRRDLLHWSLCKTFVHQFAVLARPPPKPTKRKGGHWGDAGDRAPRLWRPKPITPPKLGLAAFKHAQQRGARVAHHGKAFRALAAVQTAAQAGWPDAMRLDLLGCKTADDRAAWAQRWGAFLGGQVQAAAKAIPQRHYIVMEGTKQDCEPKR